MNLASGFIAGTLVHAPDGLVAIEKLAAGDWVLTRLDGGGPTCVRRVMRAVAGTQVEVIRVGYGVPGAASESLAAGVGHGFRLARQGWTAAASLSPESGSSRHLVLADRKTAQLEGIAPLYATDLPGVVWVASCGSSNAPGTLWDPVAGRVVGEHVPYDFAAWGSEGGATVCKAAVHDLEVDEGHSYFVGKLGVWVADASTQSGNLLDVDRDPDAASAVSPQHVPPPGLPAGDVLRERAEAGEAEAMFELALASLKRSVLPQDDRAGYEWMLKAADKGHLEAQYCVSAMSKDEARAAGYRRAAAEQGHARAQFDLGLRHETGLGVPADLALAMEWYGKAMAQGNMAAHYNLGKLWSFSGDGVKEADTGADWFRARADEGDAVAQWVTGICHEFGRAGAVRDIDEALRYYQLGAARGFGPAICGLADKYERGLGVTEDVAQALTLYYKAAKLNVPAAMYSLGCLYRDGRGVPRDLAQGVAWLRKAAEAGWVDGRAALKQLPEGDFQKARELLAMAERAGEGVQPPAQLLWELGNRVHDPTDSEALPLSFALYLHAAQQAHAEAQLQVGVRYLQGLGVMKDSEEAARWYQRAAEQGNIDAQAGLAALYETGTGLPEDAAKARHWYEQAAARGHRDAQFKLGLRTSREPTLAELGIDHAPVQVRRSWWKRW